MHIVGVVLDSVHMPARSPLPALVALTKVVVAVELSRLLRRALLVTALAVAGWLLSVVFAGAATADTGAGTTTTGDEPAQQQQSGGLLGGLLGGVTNTLTGITNSVVTLTGTVVDTTTSVLAPVVTPAPDPIIDLPELLPAPPGSSAGDSSTDRTDAVPVPPAPPAPAAVAPTPQAPPVTLAVEDVVRPAAVATQQPAPVAQEPANNADSHAGKGATDPRPNKAPAGPAGPNSTVSTAHDTSGGARGTHGVLTVQATLHPADAGFSTRSRAVDAAGRVAGLPACTPD